MLAGTTSKGNVLGLGAALLFLFVAPAVDGEQSGGPVWFWHCWGTSFSFFSPAACLGDLCFGHTYEARKQIYQHLDGRSRTALAGHGFSMFKHVSQLVIDGHQVIMPHNVYLEMLLCQWADWNAVLGPVSFWGDEISPRCETGCFNAESASVCGHFGVSAWPIWCSSV